MGKTITIEVPDWVSKEDVERLVRIVYGERSRISAEELRKMLGIEPRDKVDVPSMNVREKDRERIRWLYSTQA